MTNQSGIEGLSHETRHEPEGDAPHGIIAPGAEEADAPPIDQSVWQPRPMMAVRATQAHVFMIGPGVKQAMDDAGDVARSGEQYFHADDGSVIYSMTQGRDAMYRWTPEDGTRRLPFG